LGATIFCDCGRKSGRRAAVESQESAFFFPTQLPAFIPSEISAFIRTDERTSLDRRKHFLQHFTYYSTNATYPLTLRVTGINTVTYPLPHSRRSASKRPSKAAHMTGVIESLSLAFVSLRVAAASTSNSPSLAALKIEIQRVN